MGSWRYLEVNRVVIYTFIIWLQKYARSDWLLSGHYFLVMTGHYEIFSRLDGSFEFSKTTCAWAKTTEEMDKVQLYFQQLKEKLA